MIHIVFAIVLLLAAVASAPAQTGPDEITAAERQTTRIGALTLEPLLTIRDTGFDSNVFRRRESRGDWTTTISPDVIVRSQAGRVRMAAEGTVDFVYFQQFDSERSVNTDDRIAVEWPLGASRLNASYSYLNTRQRLDDDIDTRSRRVEQQARVGAEGRLGARTWLAGALQHERVTFDDGALTPYGWRLREVLARSTRTVAGSAWYAVTPRTAVALDAEHDRTEFELSPLRGSTGVRVGPRVRLARGGPLRGRAFLGYRHFDLLDPHIADFSGWATSFDLEYVLRETTSLRVEGDRDVSYSSRIAEPYYLRSAVHSAVTHRFSWSWDVAGGIGLRWLDYRQRAITGARPEADPPENLQERIVAIDVAAGRRFGRKTGIRLGLSHDWRRSGLSAGRDYDRLRLFTTLTRAL